jgi:rod shape-determining protein MreD
VTPRLLMMAAVLLTALLLQTVVMPLFSVAGWRADLVTLTVVAFALADGPETGARYGFVAGLVSDLLSGGNSLVGLTALVLLLVGDGVGRLRPYLAGTALVGEAAVAAGGGAVAFALYGVVALLLDLRQFTGPLVVQGTVASAVWNLVLGPVVCRPVAALSRRFALSDTPPATAGSAGRPW